MRFAKTIMVIVFVLCLNEIYGQNLSLSDTLRINEIVVNARASDNLTEAYRYTMIDSTQISEKRLLSLSELILVSAPLFIKTYGPGNLASVSFRGTGSVHTRVAWNGIVINSPMLGQSDLAIIPSAFTDEVRIDHGSRSMFTTGGAFGGLINIGTKPDWREGLRIYASSGAGSFGLFNSSIKADAGTRNFRSVTRALINRADNDFKYINRSSLSKPVFERRNNAEAETKAIMQEFFFKGNNNYTSASVWIQKSERNIPPNILSSAPPAGESQIDEFVRAMVRHTKYSEKSTFEFVSGLFFEDLNYFNKQASIESYNHFTSFTGKASWELAAGKSTKIKFIIDEELSVVNSVNYSDVKSRNISSLSGIAKKLLSRNAALTIMFRETVAGRNILFPDYSAGLEYYPVGNRNYWIKFNHSRNTRVPTLNDLYWNPGGNIHLNNEFCFSEELNSGLLKKVNDRTTIESEISAYSMRIRNMIQWMPGEFSYWSPVNFRSVNVDGFEFNVDLKHSSGKFKYNFSSYYSFNNSVYSGDTDQLKGKKLMYVPAHQLGGTARAEYSFLYFSTGFRFTGKRFTTVDNSYTLDGYFLTDAETGINLPFGRNKLNLKIRVENIFNTYYEVVAYYPMPGRWFFISVNYNYNK